MVRVVRHNTTGEIFALKQMPKLDLLRKSKVRRYLISTYNVYINSLILYICLFLSSSEIARPARNRSPLQSRVSMGAQTVFCMAGQTCCAILSVKWSYCRINIFYFFSWNIQRVVI